MERPGRWIAEPEWPSTSIERRRLDLGKDFAGIGEAAGFPVSVASPQDIGLAGGEYCAIWLGPELPGDQSGDDAKSVCFDMPVAEDTDIVGAPTVRLALSSDRSSAMVAVRLCDVQPDGRSSRITYGVLNLTHRDGHGNPKPLQSNRPVEIALQLDDIAYRIPAGHRLRVAVSTSYWPLVWPSPEPVTLTLQAGALELPVRRTAAGDEVRFEEQEGAAPWRHEVVRPSANHRTIEEDEKSGAVSLVIEDDFGEARDADHGLSTGSIARERWTIHPHDPLSARGETHWTQTLSRGDWSVRTETFASMTSGPESFLLNGRIEAYENSTLIFERDFDREIVRNGI
jgi:hypothetical protein